MINSYTYYEWPFTPTRIGKLRINETQDEYPVSLAEAKTHLRVDLSDDDNYIESLIIMATHVVEQYTRLFIVENTVDVYYDQFPDYFNLQYGNLQTVVHLKYYDTDNSQQTLDSSNYEMDKYAQPALVYRAKGVNWPETYDRPNAVHLRFTGGIEFQEYDAKLPRPLKHAILLLIGHFYENRQTVADKVQYQIPMTVEYLLNPFVVLEL